MWVGLILSTEDLNRTKSLSKTDSSKWAETLVFPGLWTQTKKTSALLGSLACWISGWNYTSALLGFSLHNCVSQFKINLSLPFSAYICTPAYMCTHFYKLTLLFSQQPCKIGAIWLVILRRENRGTAMMDNLPDVTQTLWPRVCADNHSEILSFIKLIPTN